MSGIGNRGLDTETLGQRKEEPALALDKGTKRLPALPASIPYVPTSVLEGHP